ncbi:MAG: hypothetical protein AAF639_25280 [Chloroflexota bacterium]
MSKAQNRKIMKLFVIISILLIVVLSSFGLHQPIGYTVTHAQYVDYAVPTPRPVPTVPLGGLSPGGTFTVSSSTMGGDPECPEFPVNLRLPPGIDVNPGEFSVNRETGSDVTITKERGINGVDTPRLSSDCVNTQGQGSGGVGTQVDTQEPSNGVIEIQEMDSVDAEIHYQGFGQNAVLVTGLYRVVENPHNTPETGISLASENQTFIPIQTKIITMNAEGNLQIDLSELLSLDSSQVAGEYMVLACSAATSECDHLPYIKINDGILDSINWPHMYGVLFTLGLDSTVSRHQINLLGIGDEGTNSIVDRELADPFNQTIESIIDSFESAVRHVDFTIRDYRGVEVYQHNDTTFPYCAFGDGDSCDALDFGQNENRWPAGTNTDTGKPIRSGIYTLHATIVSETGKQRVLEQTIRIALPALEANITQTGAGSASTLVQGDLVFQVEAYDPIQIIWTQSGDGSGIDNVQLEVTSLDGTVVLSATRDTAPYCLVVNNSNQCVPDEQLDQGFYTLKAKITANDGRTEQLQHTVHVTPAKVRRLADNCTELVRNGALDPSANQLQDWHYAITESIPQFMHTDDNSNRFVQLGLTPDSPIRSGAYGAAISAIYQDIEIPLDVSTLTLFYSAWPQTNMPDNRPKYIADSQEVLLLNPISNRILAELHKDVQNEDKWQYYEVDLGSYIDELQVYESQHSRYVRLYFKAFTSNIHDNVYTWMLLDDISIHACWD